MNAANERPIFIAGLDRSGKTYLRFLLAAHPAFAISRRTNLWTRTYRRFGRLDDPANLRRCLAALAANKHAAGLGVDLDALGERFRSGEPSYARLFAMLHAEYARLNGKPRWGDQTEGLERLAPVVLAAYPQGRMIHLLRDPRDRYQAALEKRSGRRSPLGGNGLGASTARWLESAALARRHARAYPGQYRVLRYEDLVTRPEETLRALCAFTGEEYRPEMLRMGGAARFAGLPEDAPAPLSAAYVGRFRGRLSPFEVAFIQRRCAQRMADFDYTLEPAGFSWRAAARADRVEWLLSTAGLLGWRARSLGGGL